MTLESRIDLLRHGEVKGGICFRGSRDDPLTDAGLKQMRDATSHNSGNDHGWDQVISSPLKRCSNFAMPLSQQLSIPITFDDRIKEIHFGDWEGRTASEIMDKTPDELKRFWSDPGKHPPPGGESLAQFYKRVIAAWNTIISEHLGKQVLVVTHGGVIRILLCHVLGIPLAQMLELEVKLGELHSVRINSIGESNLISGRNARTEDV